MNAQVIGKKIRRMANRQELTASCKTAIYQSEWYKERRWWFGNLNNKLESPDYGLTDDEALEWLGEN